jgi:hypothetical protein
VTCQGKCDGTCKGAAEGGTGTGIQADGSCDGQCEGSCEMEAGASASCEGSCEGKCDATCEAKPGGVKAECDGSCMGTASAPKCEGGTLEVNCSADVDCKGSCDASASAQAECTPPSVAVTFEASGSVDVEAQAKIDVAVASLKANLPNLLLVIQARGDAFVGSLETMVDVGASVDATGSVKAAACLLGIAGTVVEASANFKASLSAAIDVSGSVGI